METRPAFTRLGKSRRLRSSRAPWVLSIALALCLHWPGVVGSVVADDLVVDPSVDREQEFAAIAELAAEFEARSNLLRRIARLVQPSVVHIEATKLEQRREVEETGSGVIVQIGDAPYVLTNRHVIAGAELGKISIIQADGNRIHPQQMWSDPDSDVAVMSLPEGDYLPARIGDSDQVDIGSFVLAVGSPFGLSHSVTHGIISAKGRRDLELGVNGVRYQDFMQTDAAINPGNSGGPLINMRGELIGINTAIASASGGNEGIGFSIPINMVMSIACQLADQGIVRRGFLGVHLDSGFDRTRAISLGLSRRIGARVTGVTADSPAEQADFHIDDVIIRFNGRPIEDDSHLINVVSLTPIGEAVEVIVIRDGEPVRVSVAVADRSEF